MDERVYQKLGFDKIRERLALKTISSIGRQKALELDAVSEIDEVESLLQETSEAEHITISYVSFPMTSFDDIQEEMARLRAGGALSPKELLKVLRVHKAARRANRTICTDDPSVVKLKEIAEQLCYDDYLIKRIDEAIISEEEISDNASSELRDIRRRIRAENASIRDRLNSIIHGKDKSAYLQEAIVTMREGRYVVPVKAEYRSLVPGIVHSQSSTGATLFIEPMGIVEANNKLRLLEEEEAREIERILIDLSNIARTGLSDLGYDIDLLAILDLIFAKAALAIEMKAFRAELNTEGKIYIDEGRHPLIDPAAVIPVTVNVENDINTLIITGPNTGGKTVTLKLIGLLSLMTQSGLFIPAREHSTLPIFSAVFADIGDEQSIEQSLSTFSSHMKNIIYILRHADRDSLVLIDELGAGTDPEEGTALALAILTELASRKSHVFVTTHYSEIKAYALTTEGFENASMEFDPNSLQPTFRLIMGVAGSSNAFLISKRLGLKNDVIEKAKSFMREERLEFDNIMLHAEKTRKTADSKLREAEEIERKARETEAKLKSLEKEINERREKALKEAREEAYSIIRDAKDETEQILKEARKTRNQTESEATRTTKNLRTKLNLKKDRLESQIKDNARALYEPINIKEVKPGTEVHVVSLNVDGTVQTVPDAKGIVSVRCGIMTVNISYKDLQHKKEDTQKVMRTSSLKLTRKPIPLELDVHGFTVDDALIDVDKYLDDSFLAGLKEVSIIHGKGTGALRAGIHAYLKKHPHVDSFRLGKYGEGETGVTIVTLK